MSRKSARETAFKTIFEVPFHNNETPVDIITYSADSNEDLKNQNDTDYYKNITLKCFENIDEIDRKISDVLQGWTINRISKTDLAILRLAVCEICYVSDIPFQVSINEAVELSKKYGDDNSPAFINGVLAALV